MKKRSPARFAVLLLALCLLLPLQAAAGYSVTESRYIVDDVCDFSVSITDRKDYLALNKKLFSSLLGNLLEDPCYLTIVELPSQGTITNGKQDVVVLDTFKFHLFGKLRITPDANTPASFCFIASDKDGNTTPLCRLTVTPAATAGAPVAFDLAVQTGMNMKVGGQMAGSTPKEGDLVYELLTAPSKGDLSCFGAGFVYEPHEGETGRDSFTYQVRDSQGVRSEEATVSIRIDKDVEDVSYCDMGDSLNCYAALCLAREGILRGERVGGLDYFNPTQTLSQGEFLTLLMDAAGLGGADVASQTDQTPLTVAQAVEMTGNLLGYPVEILPKAGSPDEWVETSAATRQESLLTRDDAANLLWQVFCSMQ